MKTVKLVMARFTAVHSQGDPPTSKKMNYILTTVIIHTTVESVILYYDSKCIKKTISSYHILGRTTQSE